MADNAIAIRAVGTESNVIGQVDRILPLGSLTGTVGVYCNTLSGNVDLRANEIIANTAYDIVKGDVRLNCAKVVGTKVGTPVLDLSRLAEAPSVNHPDGVAGIVIPDGTTVTVTDGVLSAPVMTATALGIGRPDNITLEAVGGVIRVKPGATYFKTEFTASGSWTPSALGMYRIRGCAGGGGGGGVYVGDDRGAAGGGASGEEVDMYINITSLAAIPITIGAGGNGGTATSTANANGAAGGDTTFGSYFTLKGGLGGTGLYLATPAGARAAYPGGVSSGPGSSSGGNALFSLQAAGTYMLTQVFGGVGGASSFGAPGPIVSAGNASVSNPGIAATGYGAGGGGGACNSQRAAGGKGAPGYILIERVG